MGSDDREEAVAGQAVTIQLDKEVDVSRGCVLTNNNEIPVAKGFEATLLWMDDSRLEVGKEYLVKLGTKKIAGVVKSIEFKTDVNTGEHLHADTIEKNEIALCRIGLSDKVVLDEFKSRHIRNPLFPDDHQIPRGTLRSCNPQPDEPRKIPDRIF